MDGEVIVPGGKPIIVTLLIVMISSYLSSFYVYTHRSGMFSTLDREYFGSGQQLIIETHKLPDLCTLVTMSVHP